MSKQHKPQRRMPKQLTMKQAKLLDDIEAMIDDGEWDDAEQKLLSFTRNHPDVAPGWEVLFRLSTETQDYPTAYHALTNLVVLEPDEEEHLYNLVIVSASLKLLFIPLDYAEQFLKRFPQSSGVKEIRNLHDNTKAAVEQLRQHDEMVRKAPDFAVLRLHERSQMLVSSGKLNEARRLSLDVIKRLPGAVSPLNNISLTYALEGNLKEAIKIAHQVLQLDPENLNARANLAQFYVRLGQLGDAEPFLANLRTERPANLSHWVKLMETFAYAGEDATIIDLYERAQVAFETAKIEVEPLALHLAAASFAFTGDERKARQLWRQALKQNPHMDLVADNLANLSLPVGQRHGAWHFSFQYWVKAEVIEAVEQVVHKNARKDPAVLRQRLNAVLDSHPALKVALPIMLQRGDPRGCQLTLSFAAILPSDWIMDFAKGQRGSDSERFRAAQILVHQGVIQASEPFTMYVDGNSTDVTLRGLEVHTDSEPSQLPKRAQDLMQRGYDAIQDGEFSDALQFVNEALSIAPDDRILLGHKVNALLGLRRRGEAQKLADQLVDAHPDYFFARCLKVQFCIMDRQFAEAEAWLAPLQHQERFHISEFRSLVQLNVMLNEGKGDQQAAAKWRMMGAEVLDNDNMT
jgi:predicted Zn-dependent protease